MENGKVFSHQKKSPRLQWCNDRLEEMAMEIRLDALPLDKKGIVTKICVPEGLRRRLEDFGFIRGTIVRCCYRSPGGHATALSLRGSVLALRTRDLSGIWVKV